MPSTSTPTISGGGHWPEDTSDSVTQYDDNEVIDDITDSDVETDTGTTTISDDTKTTKVFYSSDGKLIIIVPQETMLISSGNEELSYISITLSLDTLLIPQNNTLISPIYDVTTFTAEGQYEYAELDRQVIIVIEFDNDKLPEGFSSVYAAWYDVNSGWVKLTDVLEINHEAGILTVVTTQLSNIAVFAETDMANDFIEVIPSPTDDSLKPTLPDSRTPQSKTDIKSTSAAKSTLMREILSQTSLAIAGSGTLAMATLAYFERKRRNSKRKGVLTSNTKY